MSALQDKYRVGDTVILRLMGKDLNGEEAEIVTRWNKLRQTGYDGWKQRCKVRTADGSEYFVEHVNLKELPHHKKIVKWSDCVWQPDELQA